MPDMVQTLKQIAVEAVQAESPVSLVYGTIISISPLQIRAGDKLMLTGKMLLVPQALLTRQVSASINWTTDQGAGLQTQHAHEAPHGATTTNGFDPSHTHTVAGTLSLTLHSELAAGDSVLLLRMQGGQQYLVLGKVVCA